MASQGDSPAAAGSMRISFGRTVQSEVPSSEWVSKLLRDNPSLLEHREVLRHLRADPSYGRSHGASLTLSKRVFPHDVVIRLLMQYLLEEGFTASAERLHRETGQPMCEDANGMGSRQLYNMIAAGLDNLQDVWKACEVSGTVSDAPVEVYDVLPRNVANSTEEVPIWDDNTCAVCDEDDDANAVSGTLNQLVRHYVDADNLKTEWKMALLMTHSVVTSDKVFLDKLTEYLSGGSGNDEETSHRRQRALRAILYWISKCPLQWGEALQARLGVFLEQCGLPDVVKMLRNGIANKDEPATAVYKQQRVEEPLVPRNIFSPKLQLSDVDVREVARQLALLDHQHYRRLQPCEVLRRAWLDTDVARTRAPNVTALLERCARTSLWVASHVLVPHLKQRVTQFSYFVRLANHLLQLNAFHTCFAVVNGLVSAPVHRLRRTRLALPNDVRDLYLSLRVATNYNSSFQTYRNALARVGEVACIPYLPVHLAHSASVDAHVRRFLPDGSINMRMLQQSWDAIRPLFQRISLRFPFRYVHQVAQFVRVLKPPDEDTLWRLSCRLEPT